MIYLRKHRFWSRSPATVECDSLGCKRSAPVDLLLQPQGGFAMKFSKPGLWFAVVQTDNLGFPTRTFCVEHKPDLQPKRVQEASPAQAAEANRLLHIHGQRNSKRS